MIDDKCMQEPARFRPLSRFHKQGVARVFYKGDAKQIPETEEERALAQVAREKWDTYQKEFAPLEDKYIANVNKLDDKAHHNYTAGLSNSAATNAYGSSLNKLASATAVDPNSGKFKSAQSTIAMDQGMKGSAMESAAHNSQTDEYVSGLQNVAAIGQGQSTLAQAGLSDVANAAQNRAAQDAYSAFNNEAMNRQFAGDIVGAGLGYYKNKDKFKKPKKEGID